MEEELDLELSLDASAAEVELAAAEAPAALLLPDEEPELSPSDKPPEPATTALVAPDCPMAPVESVTSNWMGLPTAEEGGL